MFIKYFFIIGFFCIHSFDCISTDQQSTFIDNPLISKYKQMEVTNFAASWTSKIFFFMGPDGEIEISAVTLSNSPHMEGWAHYKVLKCEGREDGHLHHRSSFPPLLQTHEHIKSIEEHILEFENLGEFLSIISLETTLSQSVYDPYLEIDIESLIQNQALTSSSSPSQFYSFNNTAMPIIVLEEDANEKGFRFPSRIPMLLLNGDIQSTLPGLNKALLQIKEII